LLWHVALSYFVENIHNRTIIQNFAHFCNTLKAKFAKNNTPIFVAKLQTILCYKIAHAVALHATKKAMDLLHRFLIAVKISKCKFSF